MPGFFETIFRHKAAVEAASKLQGCFFIIIQTNIIEYLLICYCSPLLHCLWFFDIFLCKQANNIVYNNKLLEP